MSWCFCRRYQLLFLVSSLTRYKNDHTDGHYNDGHDDDDDFDADDDVGNDDDLQIGRGRTTNAMVVACLVKEIQITTELKYDHHDDCQDDDDN